MASEAPTREASAAAFASVISDPVFAHDEESILKHGMFRASFFLCFVVNRTADWRQSTSPFLLIFGAELSQWSDNAGGQFTAIMLAAILVTGYDGLLPFLEGSAATAALDRTKLHSAASVYRQELVGNAFVTTCAALFDEARKVHHVPHMAGDSPIASNGFRVDRAPYAYLTGCRGFFGAQVAALGVVNAAGSSDKAIRDGVTGANILPRLVATFIVVLGRAAGSSGVTRTSYERSSGNALAWLARYR